MNTIFKKYIIADPAIEHFFNFPLNPDWLQVAEQVLSQNRTFLLDLLHAQNVQCPFAAQKHNLKKLQQKNTVLIVTGQQLGFLISPLYTLYKALTAIALSERLNQLYPQFNFLPVFWLEGEDHDFAEINHFYFFDRNNQLQKIVIDPYENDRKPVSVRSLPANISQLLDELKNAVQTTEFSSVLFEQLKHIYRPGVLWLDAFKERLQRLLGPFGLLFFNPSDEQVKAQSMDFFCSLIQQNDTLLKALKRQTQAIAKPQVPIQADRSFLFVVVDGKERQPILRKGGGSFQIFGDTTIYSAESLCKFLENKPAWVSSSVLTRPLWQSYLLPVVSYVAGPAEIAYWAQLKQAFQEFDLVMPQLQPRFSATLIEPRIKRLLQKFNLKPEQVKHDFGSWVKTLIKDSFLKQMEELTTELKRKQHQTKLQLIAFSPQIDPTLTPVIHKTFNTMEKQIDDLTKRLSRIWRNKNENTMEQLKSIHAYFFPQGKVQERVLGSVYFFNKFGEQWLSKIYAQINLDDFKRHFVEL